MNRFAMLGVTEVFMVDSMVAYQSKAVRLSQLLLDEIQRGRYAAGTRLPPEMDLAQRYRVSRPTVRRALDILAGDGHVVRRPQRGVVVAEGVGRETELRQIAFISRGLNADMDRYVCGLMDAMDHERFTLAIYATNADIGRYRRNIENIVKTKPAGIVLTTIPQELLAVNAEILTGAGVPIVTIGHPEIAGLCCDRVDEPGIYSGQAVARFILRKGFRDVAYMGTSPRGSNEETVEALRGELAPAGIELPDERVFIVDAPSGYMSPPQPFADCRRFMADQFARGFRCETLIAGHDYPAVGALFAAMEADVRVPGDMKVISAMRNAVEGLSPMRLTTVDFNLAEEGRLAMKLLSRRIDGYTGPIEVHHTPVELIEGETA